MLRAPREHGTGKDVVVDLVPVAGMTVLARRAQDALARERLQHGFELRRLDARKRREVGDAVRDLCARRRDEVVEHAGRDVALRRRQCSHRAVEMVLDDPLRAAELGEGRELQQIRAAFALDFPQPLQNELQVGRLDPRPVLLADAAAADEPGVDPARRDLGEQGRHELRLDVDVRCLELVVPLERAEDRRARLVTVEAVETEVVREQPGDVRLEDVELCELVVADPEHHVHAQAWPRDELGQRLEEAAFGLVEEELLELVEHEDELGAQGCSPGVEAIGEVARRVARVAAEGIGKRTARRVLDRRDRVARPAAHVGDGELLGRGQPAQLVHDACPQERRLADAARAVQHRQAGSEGVRDDDLRLARAPEEEQRVQFTVVEGAQPLVRAAHCFRDDRHRVAPSIAWTRMSATNSSRSRELGSTPRRFQNSRSTAPAEG